MSSERRAASVKASVLAGLFDLSERRIRQLADAGVIPKAARGEYPLAQAIRGYVKFVGKDGRGPDDEASTFRRSRARLMNARAALAEIEQAEREGDLVPATQVEEGWIKIAAIIRARLLALPSKMAPRLAAMSSAALIEAALRDEVYSALTDIAETEVVVTSDDGGVDSAEA